MSDAEHTLARKILKGFGILLGSLFGLVLLVSLLLLTFLEPMAEQYLKKQVQKSSDGLYTLDFEDMDLELLTGSLVLKSLRFSPDSAVHRQQREAGEASPQLLDIRAPRAEIAGANWLKALLSKQVRIGNVILHEPTITLLADDRVEKNNQKPTGKKGVSAFVKSLHIDKVHIPNATYRYLPLEEPSEPRYKVSQASLQILNLQVENLDQPDYTKMFHADDIRVEIRDYAYHSPDSVYEVQVAHFSYSSKEGELVADSIKIRADNVANTSRSSGKASRTVYDVAVPQFRISGLDVVEAYKSKHLRINQILLQNPALNILQNPNVPADSGSMDPAALYQRVSDYLRVVEVGEFRVADGSLALRNQKEKNFPIHELKKVTLALQSIRLDSTVLLAPTKNFFAEEILVSVRDYTYQHPQSPHTVKVANLTLSTRDRYFQADSLRVIGDWDQNNRLKQSGKAQAAVYNFDLPLLRISNMDVIQVLETPHLDIGRIVVQRPTLSALYDRNVKSGDSQANLRQMYRRMSGFINRLRVGEIRLEGGTFAQHEKENHVRQIQKLEHASVVATSLHLDSAFFLNPGEELPLEEVVVVASKYSYWMPDQTYTFHLGSLRYSTRSKELSARSIDIRANAEANKRLKQSNSALYDLSASQFSVTGFDVVSAYNAGQLVVDEVVLWQPELDILHVRDVAAKVSGENQQSGIEQVLALVNPIRARSIRLENGTLTYREQRAETIRTHVLNHASATVAGLHLSPQTLNRKDEESLPLQELNLTARDYTYRSPDLIYTTTLGSLHYSSRQQVLTARSMELVADKKEHERLKQENPDLANRNLFDVSAQKFQITGLDLIPAFGTGQFVMREIVLTAPEVAILQNHRVPVEDGEQEQGGGQGMKQLGELVDVFRVGRLRLEDGFFTFSIQQDTVLRSQRVEHISIALDNLRLVSLQANDPLEMFAVNDMEVVVRDYSSLTPDSLYLFEVGEIRSSLRDQSLSIDSLRLAPLFKEEEFSSRLQYAQDRYDIKVPQINLRGIDLQALFSQQELIVQKGLIDMLALEIYRDNRVPQDPNRRPLTLQNMLRQIDFYVRIDTISLNHGKLTYSEIPPNGVEPGVLMMEEMVFDLTNITNDSSRIQRNNITSFVASTRMMGESTLEVAFRLHLNHPEDLYTYTGTLASMDFTAFNPLFENLTSVRIESGQINQVTFAVEATEHKATGRMTFLYNDLNIQLLNPDDPGKPGFWRQVGSWLANRLVIKSNNPSGKRDPRVGSIEVDRNYQKSVFNHMSKAMMDGMSSNFIAPVVKRIMD